MNSLSKIVLTLALLTGICLSDSPLMAQMRLPKEEFSLGVQGGYMASMVMFTPAVSQQPLHSYFGPTAGLIFRYAGHRVCGLQVELNYMQKGWQQYYETDDGPLYGYRRQLDYIELPLLSHFSFGKKRTRGFFNLGPQIGYLLHEAESGSMQNIGMMPGTPPGLSGNATATNGHPSGTYHQYCPVENRFDWGAAAGLGICVRTLAGTWNIEARFNYSLGALFSTSQMDYFSMSNPMNASLTAAWLWNFKHK